MVLLCSLIFLAFQTVATTPGEVAAQGRSWEQFLQSIRERRDLWLKNEFKASVAPELVARVERAGRGLQLIVVAEDCPDSAYTCRTWRAWPRWPGFHSASSIARQARG